MLLPGGLPLGYSPDDRCNAFGRIIETDVESLSAFDRVSGGKLWGLPLAHWRRGFVWSLVLAATWVLAMPSAGLARDPTGSFATSTAPITAPSMSGEPTTSARASARILSACAALKGRALDRNRCEGRIALPEMSQPRNDRVACLGTGHDDCVIQTYDFQ